MVVRLTGRVTLVGPPFMKALAPIVVTPAGTVADPVQLVLPVTAYAVAAGAMVSEPDVQFGSAKLVTAVPCRMLAPILVTLLGEAKERVVRLAAPLKAFAVSVVTLVGIVMPVIAVPSKVFALMAFRVLPAAKVTVDSRVAPARAREPRLDTVAGMVMLVSPVAPWKALVPMLVRVEGSVMVVSPVAPWNALVPMFVTLLGRVILVSPVASWNALLSMLVMLVGRVAVPVQLVLAVMAYVVAAGARV